MAIPFYEPRQQHHANECDQIDGNFPPAPSSQAMSVPTASTNMTIEPPAAVNAATLFTTLHSTAASSSTAATSSTANSTTNIFAVSPSASATNSNAVTATFSFPTSTPAAAATASLATQTIATEFTTTASSTTAPSTTDPLPWKLLAVSMCKALKQYYQQNGANSAFTTAVIEILPSSVSAAQE